MREDFSALRLPDWVAELYPPDRDGLFTRLRAEVTDQELQIIASADYGSDKEEHLAALRDIKAGVSLDQPMQWNPNVVLELARWTDKSDEYPSELSFHRARAFACACLMHIPEHNDNRRCYEPGTLGNCVISVRWLGSEYEELLRRDLTWAASSFKPWDEDFLFVGFALLALHLWKRGSELRESDHELIAWFVSSHDEIIKWHQNSFTGEVKTFVELPFVHIGSIWKQLVNGLKQTHGDDPLLGPFLARISVPTNLKTKAKKVAFVTKLALWVGRDMLSMLWRMRRKE